MEMETLDPFIPGSDASKAMDIPGMQMLKAGSKGTEVSFPIPGTDEKFSTGFCSSAEEAAEGAFKKWRQINEKHLK